MKKMHSSLRFALAAAMSLAVNLSSGSAADMPEGAVKVSGKVSATRHEKYQGPGKGLPAWLSWRQVKAGTITVGSGEVYHIVMDEKGSDFARTMNRETVEVFGKVQQKGDAKWLTVLAYADSKLESAHELWRRMRCNACIVAPATINATPSSARALSKVPSVTGRYHSLKDRYWCWTRDAKNLWLATDNEITRIDLAKKSVVQTYDKSRGLPDSIIYQLFSDGKHLWIVYKGGVAALKIGDDKIVDLPALKSGFARVCSAGAGVWVIADTGTFKLKSPDAKPDVYPALPTGKRISKLVKKGIWLPHWKRKTGHYIVDSVVLGDYLCAGSYGSIYALDVAKRTWSRVSSQGWEMKTRADRLWFVSSMGVVEADVRTGQLASFSPAKIGTARPSRFVLTDRAAWVAFEANPETKDTGGLARFDLAKRQWQIWKEINGQKADHIDSINEKDGSIWVIARSGGYRVKAAHPGMTHVKRKRFDATGFSLHVYNVKEAKWHMVPLKSEVLEQRVICGQDGSHGVDVILPQSVDDMAIGGRRIFASLRLFPKAYFSGYWPCLLQIASRAKENQPWKGKFLHRPEELNLQGEQPDVLNISNKGEMILEAVGHDNVSGQFVDNGTHWAITEGCVGYFNERAGRWTKVTERNFRFYWRATAALDTGDGLYVGSDRGVVSRLDFKTGRFEILTTLKGRCISGIAREKDGGIVVTSVQATLGMLPIHLRSSQNVIDGESARFDGKSWTKCEPVPSLSSSAPTWFFRLVDKRHNKDKSKGNVLFGPVAGKTESQPRFYVKEVFFPLFLCASEDGRRVWVSTFTGLLRLDIEPKGKK